MMNARRLLATALAIGCSLAAVGAPLCLAQTTTAPPIRVKVKIPKPKEEWLEGEVIRADVHSMTVRERKKPLYVHTFTYSPKVREQMEKLLNRGGYYQPGDKVKIRHVLGQEVALAIRGKPSKPF